MSLTQSNHGSTSNRIEARFGKLKASNRKGLVVYIGAGDPDLQSTIDLALAFDRAGVDVLELGVPFSDPLADGLVNQLAAQRGLNSGTTPAKVLDAVRRIRQASSIPVVLYIYYNLVHRRGLQAFVDDCSQAGVDGLLILDLPPEESEDYESKMRHAGLCPIYLIAPTTTEERIERIVRRGSGFIYYVSREGVTGMQQTVAQNIGAMTSLIRKHSPLPIAVGFGVSNPEQAKIVASTPNVDAVVVGSAIVNRIAAPDRRAGWIQDIADFAATLKSNLDSVP